MKKIFISAIILVTLIGSVGITHAQTADQQAILNNLLEQYLQLLIKEVAQLEQQLAALQAQQNSNIALTPQQGQTQSAPMIAATSTDTITATSTATSTFTPSQNLQQLQNLPPVPAPAPTPVATAGPTCDLFHPWWQCAINGLTFNSSNPMAYTYKDSVFASIIGGYVANCLYAQVPAMSNSNVSVQVLSGTYYNANATVTVTNDNGKVMFSLSPSIETALQKATGQPSGLTYPLQCTNKNEPFKEGFSASGNSTFEIN